MIVYEPGVSNLPKDKSTGTFSATIENEPSFIAEKIIFHHFGGEKPGGMIIGTNGDRFVDIGFPAGIGDTPDWVTKKYPEDFEAEYLQWDYQPTTGPRAIANKGKLRIKFSDSMKRAEGSFEFVTTEHPPRTVEGKFNIQIA
jgi:hypothetical protein